MNSRKGTLFLFLGSLLATGCGGNVDLGGPPLTKPSAGAQLALGAEHTCAVVKGHVYCWGVNRNGEVGDGTMRARATPVLVPGLDGVLEIAAGGAFDSGGTRGSHTCARLTDGTVLCWGANVDSQTDDGTIESRRLLPTPVAGLTDVVDIDVSRWNTCAVHGDGSVSCWGRNDFDLLGPGPSHSSTPVKIEGLEDVVEVALGVDSACARHADRTVSCWGGNSVGQLGDGTTTDRGLPAAILGLSDVEQISASSASVCARLGDGTVRCWGHNSTGQLGDASSGHRRPVLVALSGAQQLSVGGLSSCARTGTSASCWGRDFGFIPSVDFTPPHAVMGLTDVAEIASGPMNHVCARLTDGQVACWGWNDANQLGDGTTESRSMPTRVVF